MYRSSIIITLLWSLVFSFTPLQAKKSDNFSVDKLIMVGLLYDGVKSYDNSYQVYEMLYEMTQEKAFFFRKINASLLGEIYLSKSIKEIKKWVKEHQHTIKTRRFFIGLYLMTGQTKKAIKEADELLKISVKPRDLHLSANAYFYGNKFKKALSLLEKLYEKEPSEEVLLRMSMIMDIYTKQRKKAISFLETYIRLYRIVSDDVYHRLLLLYRKQNDIEGILRMNIALYDRTKEKVYLKKILSIYRYQKKFDKAIVFLEKNAPKSETLFNLYKSQRSFRKAIELSDALYQKKSNPKWIAEKAVLLLEKLLKEKKRGMIPKALNYFEEAIKLGNDDSIYLNYYGYTLIDEELDVKKGIKIIKEALLQQPKNSYYLDSLAWGYYKQKECKKAFSCMKKVVEEEGLKEKEIALHWDAIKSCK